MDESKIPLGDAVVGMNSEIRGLYERYETAAPVMISCGVFTRPQSFAQWLVGQLGEHIAREAELQAEIERLMSLDGERCKSHSFYLILSSRLEDELARKQLDCDALTARVKTLEDALHTRELQSKDLAMLIRRMLRHLRDTKPAQDTGRSAVDYLLRKELLGSVLRCEDTDEQALAAKEPIR